MATAPTTIRGGWMRKGSQGPVPLPRPERRADHRSERKLERIEALAIPPAWKDVWISSRSTAKLQATGYDKAGRKQYLYHPEYRARRSRRSTTG